MTAREYGQEAVLNLKALEQLTAGKTTSWFRITYYAVGAVIFGLLMIALAILDLKEQR